MMISHAFALFLIIGQKMLLASGGCSYNKDLKKCSCSLEDLTNIMSIVSCIQASSLEFEGGRLVDSEDYSLYNVEMEQVLAMIHLPLTKVVFINVFLSEDFLITFLSWVKKVQIDVLAFVNTTFVGNFTKQHAGALSPHILSLQFINVTSYPLFDRVSNFSSLQDWIFNLEALTMINSHLTNIPCNISQRFELLSSLDLSENLFQDENIPSSFCEGAFPNLMTLKLRYNYIVNYDIICQTINKQNQLRHLDLSQNNFSSTTTSLCRWQESLVLLNLSDTGLKQINDNLPQKCEVLDLSYNKLNTLNLSLHSLKELYLSHNMFTTISTMGSFPLLEVLEIDGNPIKTIHRGQLQYFRHLNSFRANNIPYICSCSLVQEIKDMTKSGLMFQHWPNGYMCDSPNLLKGKRISEVNLSFFECHKPLLTVLICIVILLVLVAAALCVFKAHRSKMSGSRNLQTGNISHVQFQS